MVDKKESKETINGIVWKYLVRNGEATVCRMGLETHVDELGAVSIPAVHGGYPVASIGEGQL